MFDLSFNFFAGLGAALACLTVGFFAGRLFPFKGFRQ